MRHVAVAILAGCAAARGATGTCFFAAPGRAVSSLHVVRDARDIWVRDAAGRVTRATQLAADEEADLVELQVDTEAPVLALATSDPPIGAPVAAYRAGEAALRGSIVSVGALGRAFLLGTSIAAVRGASGGPLLDARGAVAGVMVRRRTGERLAFAVAASRVRAAFGDLPAAPHLADPRAAVCEVLVRDTRR
ncbi:MAG TPA: serine protease [Kofleriaceae bacterium]|jgi:S1-C subfamily serine protease